MYHLNRAAIGFLLGLPFALVPACGGSQGEPRDPHQQSDDPCADSDIAVKRVWNEETSIEVRAKVLDWGGEIGTDIAEQKALEITNSMDRLSDDWARMRKAVCNDHFKRHTLTKEEYQGRADCLDELLTRQRAFLSSLTTPEADVDRQLSEINHALEVCR